MNADHTQECQDKTNRIKRVYAEWAAQHPNHCKACGGNGGGAHSAGTVPYGSTWVSLPDEWEPCDECVSQLICPWCGVASLDDTGNGPCSACGWSSNSTTPTNEDYCICTEPEIDWSEYNE